jgi:hypothetical protein
VIWPFSGGVQRAVIELKILRKSRAQTVQDGMAQVWSYADRCKADEAHLVIFDRTEGSPWSEKIFKEDGAYRAPDGREMTIGVWGM